MQCYLVDYILLYSGVIYIVIYENEFNRIRTLSVRISEFTIVTNYSIIAPYIILSNGIVAHKALFDFRKTVKSVYFIILYCVPFSY